MIQTYIQGCLFGDDEIIQVEVKEKSVPLIVQNTISKCSGLDNYDMEKCLRLEMEYVRLELRRFFGVYGYQDLIQAIRKYNKGVGS